MKSHLKSCKPVFYIAVVLFFLFANVPLKAQENVKYPDTDPVVNVYLGLGTGVNTNSGVFGIAFNVPITTQFQVIGGAGIGSWGFKVGAGLSYNLRKSTYGPSLSVGYSNASGLGDFETELETTTSSSETVTLDLKSAANLNLMYNYQWKSGKKNKMVLGAGYSIKMTKDAYEVTSGQTLTRTSERVVSMLQPGGIILSFTYMFGL